jgi:quercetin dioxygenase-like cupin family protein
MKNMLATLVIGIAASLSLTPNAAAVGAAKAGGATFVAAADIRWSDVPGTPGVQIAPLQGDPGKGPSHFLLKYAGGFSAPVHHHTADHFVTVVAGTVVLVVDGKEQKLGAGSYFSFSGKKQHATRCEAGPDCVLAMDVRGRWNVVPAAARAARP